MVPIPVRALACIAALLAGCASGGQPTGGLRPTATMNAETIRGEWRLAAMTIDGKPRALPRDPVATLAFGPDASATGRAWINRYFGSYETAEGGKLRWPGPGFGATRMAGPQDLMDLEAAYLAALARTASATMREKRLVLQSPDGKVTMEFER